VGAAGDPPPSLLEPFRRQPRRAAVLSDFDGTLAPIVEDPEASRPLPQVVEVLGALAGRYGRVGIVSGRPVAFLRSHLDDERLVLVGQYGLEWRRGRELVVHPEAERWQPVVEEVAALADREVAPGILVERKGLAVTLHYRGQPALEAAGKAWAEGQAARTGLAVLPGRLAYELRPPLELDKGTAVKGAAEGMGAACFIGDDRGDLPAFDALDQLAATGVDTVRVGVLSIEAPPEILGRADLVVDGPEGVLRFLRALLRPFRPGRRASRAS